MDEVNALLSGGNAPAPDSQAAAEILGANAHLNFVKRLLNPDAYPKIWNRDGSYSTHLMGWSTVDGRHIVYPTIVQPVPGGPLRKFAPDPAVQYALKTGEYIPFSNPRDADWFSQRYKAGMPSFGNQAPNWEPEE